MVSCGSDFWISWVLLHLWSKTKIRMITTFQRTSSIACAGRWRPKKSSMNRASILVRRCDDVCDFRVQCRHNTQASWNPCKYWRYWRDAKLRLPHKCSGFWVQYYNALQSERPDSLGVFFTEMQKSSWRSVAQWLYSAMYDASSPWRLTFVLASVRRIGIAIALKGKSFSPIITSSGFGRLFYQRSSLLDWSSVRVRL